METTQQFAFFPTPIFLGAQETLGTGTEGPDSRLAKCKLIKLSPFNKRGSELNTFIPTLSSKEERDEKRASEGENTQPGDMNFFLLRYIYAAPEQPSNVRRKMKEKLP